MMSRALSARPATESEKSPLGVCPWPAGIVLGVIAISLGSVLVLSHSPLGMRTPIGTAPAR